MLCRKLSQGQRKWLRRVFFNEGISNKCFKTNEMIQCTAVLPEAALLLGKKTLRLEGPHEASVDHRFTQTNAIGLKLPGSEWSLPGLGMGITTASRHDGGKQPDSQTWLYTFKRTDRAEFGRCVKSW